MKTTFQKSLFAAAALLALSLAADAQNATAAQNGTQDPSKAPTERGKMVTRDNSGNVHAPNGFLRSQGTLMYLKDGQLSRVSYEMKLSEGLVARPNGEVVLRDGRTVTLQEGQMVTLDGTMTQAPKGLGSTAPGSSSTQVLDRGPKLDFGNEGAGAEKRGAEKQQPGSAK
jgi:hypothetical protein